MASGQEERQMNKFFEKGRQALKEMEEAYFLLGIVMAFCPMILLIDHSAGGLEIGFLSAVVFLLAEGIMMLLKNRIGKIGWRVSYLCLIICFSGIAALLFKAFAAELTKEMPVGLLALCFCLNCFLLWVFVKERKKEEPLREPWMEPKIVPLWQQYLKKIFISLVFMVCLWVLGTVRELLGEVVLLAQLAPGGFFLTAFYFRLWKTTGKMSEKFGKLPILFLSTGLMVMVLYGFAGLV